MERCHSLNEKRRLSDDIGVASYAVNPFISNGNGCGLGCCWNWSPGFPLLGKLKSDWKPELPITLNLPKPDLLGNCGVASIRTPQRMYFLSDDYVVQSSHDIESMSLL